MKRAAVAIAWRWLPRVATAALLAVLVLPVLVHTAAAADHGLAIERQEMRAQLMPQRYTARADPVSQTIKTIAIIDGHFSELLAGMSGKVLIAPPGKRAP